MFPLCRTCAYSELVHCGHTEHERSMVGTWTTDELKMAIQKGYKLLKLFEVWHFDKIAVYNNGSQCGGLFSGYIDCFMKLKQQASGWPDNVITEDDKKQYIQDYFDTEGIQLDHEKIEKNPGLRSLAKLMLNSFWGKFGQRSYMTKLEHVKDPSKYFDMLTSDSQ